MAHTNCKTYRNWCVVICKIGVKEILLMLSFFSLPLWLQNKKHKRLTTWKIVISLLFCAQDKTRTCTPLTSTTPSKWRVYQFHHLGIISKTDAKVYTFL